MEPGNCFLCHCAGGVHAQVAQYLEEVERKGQICEVWDSIHSNRTRIAESMPFASLLLLAAQKQQKGLGEEGPVRSEIISSSIIVIIILLLLLLGLNAGAAVSGSRVCVCSHIPAFISARHCKHAKPQRAASRSKPQPLQKMRLYCTRRHESKRKDRAAAVPIQLST